MTENLSKIFLTLIFLLFSILILPPIIFISQVSVLITTLIWYLPNVLLVLWIYIVTSFLNFPQKIVYFVPLLLIIILYIPLIFILTLIFIIIYILYAPIYYQLSDSITNTPIIIKQIYNDLYKLINLFWFANMNLELLLNNYKIYEQKFYSEPLIIKIIVTFTLFIIFLIINFGFFTLVGLLMYIPIVMRMSFEFIKTIVSSMAKNNIFSQLISILFLICAIIVTPIICMVLYICTLVYSFIGTIRSIKYAFFTNFIDFNIEHNTNDKIYSCCCYNLEFLENYILSVISYISKKTTQET
ncbi:hypothetical protein H012_gp353 [Acanthamoeba polyphaga moumouvirus]|uniref:Transmembrane protein n=1 Tax=Acanthamoeba polyphaga moumouvirus TaxID=1269028 RepID=L7RDG6_9VIRU|nr:hypothetical protein H012_gp353 [Acanthamoeba polyphaga moumouvirus]AGC02103.1 hypothetical protein Moumou_00575 [Acanthamoeba polyphaga moumouvirus]